MNLALSKRPDRRGIVHFEYLICWRDPICILISGPPFNFIAAVIFDGLLLCIACTESISGVH